MRKKSENWFVRYGIHVIIASAIPSVLAYCLVQKVSNKINTGNLVRTIIPEIFSGDHKRQQLALFALEIGTDKETADNAAGKVGIIYGDEVIESANAGDLKAAFKKYEQASMISPVTFQKARETISKRIPSNNKEADGALNLLLSYDLSGNPDLRNDLIRKAKMAESIPSGNIK